MKVLASAYACEPGQGSEAGIGWNWARQIAQRHDLLLVTRVNNVAAIEAAAHAEGLERLRVIGFDLPAWARAWKRGARGAVAYFSLWQRALGRYARELDRARDFDVVHHLTFASSWIPSGLAGLGKPFVWGPVGQHPRIPSAYLAPGPRWPRIAERAKAWTRTCCARWDPTLAHTLAAADVILSLGSEFEARLPAAHRPRVVRMLAAGVEATALAPRRFERSGGLRVLFAGRLIDLKGVRLALEAFAQLARVADDARFELCGDGPLRAALTARVSELRLDGRVSFAGHLSHAATLERMRAADVFLFPSFEGGGMVVPEAMAAGCAVVCLACGGPGDMASAGRGVRVPVAADPAQTVTALGQALIDLASDEQLRAWVARAGQRWASATATWDHKGASLEQLYERARAHHAQRTQAAERRAA